MRTAALYHCDKCLGNKSDNHSGVSMPRSENVCLPAGTAIVYTEQAHDLLLIHLYFIFIGMHKCARRSVAHMEVHPSHVMWR